MSSELDQLLSAAKPATTVPETLGAASVAYARRYGRQRRLRHWLTATTVGVGLGVLGVSAAAATSPAYEQPQWVADVTRPAVLPNGQACTIEFWFIPNADQVKKDGNLAFGTDAVQKAARVLQTIDFTSPGVLSSIVATDAYAREQGFASFYEDVARQQDLVARLSASATAQASGSSPEVAASAAAKADSAAADSTVPGYPDILTRSSYAAGAREFAVQQFRAASIDTSRVDLLNGNSTITLDCGDGKKSSYSVGP